jgi:hypothetical protein
MSEKAEEFARELLEKTKDGKLKWQTIAAANSETFEANADDGISFHIMRNARGDDKILTFELTELGRVVLRDTESNFGYATDSDLLREQAMGFMLNKRGGQPSQPYDSRISRFRLYSDLFHAAREVAEGGNQAIEKAQEFLRRLA